MMFSAALLASLVFQVGEMLLSGADVLDWTISLPLLTKVSVRRPPTRESVVRLPPWLALGCIALWLYLWVPVEASPPQEPPFVNPDDLSVPVSGRRASGMPNR